MTKQSTQVHLLIPSVSVMHHSLPFRALRQSPALRNRQIAGPRPFPYQLRPCAGPVAVDRGRTPAVRGPFVRREHNTGRAGNERLESSDSTPVRVGIPEAIWLTHAGLRRGYRVASVRRQVFRPTLSIFAAGTAPFENLHWFVPAVFPSINLPRNNTG